MTLVLLIILIGSAVAISVGWWLGGRDIGPSTRTAPPHDPADPAHEPGHKLGQNQLNDLHRTQGRWRS